MPSTIRAWTIASVIPCFGVLAVIGIAGWLREVLRQNDAMPTLTGLDTSERDRSE